MLPSVTMPQTSNPERKVPTRRISFEASLQDLPKHFAADGDLILSHLAASLSAVFPDGEDFFVRSVRHFRDQITDPELKRQVAGFIGQEAMHGREHRVFNDRLDELGYPTKQVERITAGPRDPRAPRAGQGQPGRHRRPRALHRHARRAGPHQRGDPRPVRPRRGPQPLPVARARGVRAQGRRLRRLQGRRRHRAHAGVDDERPPLRLRPRHDRRRSWCRCCSTGRPIGRATCAGAGAGSAGRRSCSGLWDQLRDYNRPDFHPDDRDTTELVEQWRAELFGEDGTLNDKLATKATSAA